MALPFPSPKYTEAHAFIGFHVPDAVRTTLDQMAREQGRSRASMLRRMVEKELRAEDRWPEGAE